MERSGMEGGARVGAWLCGQLESTAQLAAHVNEAGVDVVRALHPSDGLQGYTVSLN